MKYFYIIILLFIISYVSTSAQQSRIYGGYEINISQAPWQVLIKNNGKTGGGGCIIGNQWILTAKHCTMGDLLPEMEIIYGISCKSEIKESNTIRVSGIIRHPSTDLALLKLEKPIELSDKAQIISMASPSIEIAAGSSAFVTGWGSSLNSSDVNCLRRANVVTVNRERMDELCGDIFYNPENHIVTEGQTPEQSTGGGDSGGPLVIMRNGTPLLIGIVSGFCSKTATLSTFYPRISNYYNWIITEMNKNRSITVDYTYCKEYCPICTPNRNITATYTIDLGSKKELPTCLLYKNSTLKITHQPGDGTKKWSIIDGISNWTVTGNTLEITRAGSLDISNTPTTSTFRYQYIKSDNEIFNQDFVCPITIINGIGHIHVSIPNNPSEIIIKNPSGIQSRENQFSGKSLKTSNQSEKSLFIRYEIHNVYNPAVLISEESYLLPGEEKRIDISRLERGIYVINVFHENKKVQSEKFQVN